VRRHWYGAKVEDDGQRVRARPGTILGHVNAMLERYGELIELAPHETSLDFFRKIYHSVKQPMTRRMRAAEFALQFEHPKLGAIATASMNG
jgi:hypothetical protein